ncbi:hypothetical protein CRG98_040380 [Punica granatum]|uniref:NADP-dependent oxidoreductase domain-containing protein n=1 Tax=Punica granatum TaxID=22663 RepID=A0A2I0I5K9_PUNGR|nr:hypothetical protein CRG98_040380 [Punica granatum]
MRGDRVQLSCGVTIPILGFGTYSYPHDQEETEAAVRSALKMGYRHFDTAKIYGSEAAVGKALTTAMEEEGDTIVREDVFLTSKLWSSDHHDPVSALKKSLQTLGMEYVDMYLVHWPVKFKPWAIGAIPKEDEFEPKLEMEETWAGMERCLDMGLCRCIGVEMHPMWRQRKLREVCAENEIHVSAYSPLGAPGNLWGSTAVVDDPIIQSIAFKHRASPAQVALQWGISKGVSVIAKSFNKNRMRENMGALDLELDCRDLLEIDKLEERKMMRGEFLVNETSSPYRTIQDLWDGEI